jgi:hypothetical protein
MNKIPVYDPDFNTYEISGLLNKYKRIEACLRDYESGEITHETAKNFLVSLSKTLQLDPESILASRKAGATSLYTEVYDQHYEPSWC